MSDLLKSASLSQICHKIHGVAFRPFFVIIVILLVVTYYGWAHFSPITFEHSSLYIQSGSRMWPIDIEIAKTERQKQKGLMFRRRVPQGTGMLFLSEEPQLSSMWMKNTLIPLDMVFIDKNGIIVCIAVNNRPRSTTPVSCNQPVLAVLELPGGTVQKRLINVGDIIIHPIFMHPAS